MSIVRVFYKDGDKSHPWNPEVELCFGIHNMDYKKLHIPMGNSIN